ncbi:XRE family transcriptional regulator [Cryobacterium sp. TmT2-59]|uniref:helix-turn-helix domain-containing protein n=1 Tax=Cryobacterium sp. TmT2-59 TaxID=1259264 RepID=UPI001068FD98|nr:helix-turn-helix transcriptional regulator [Cryobacterium sp. TmT2-59]TFC85799.1 XRE family transcriptional regulator [Cryobacterium sp. TmT2-59]
MTIEPIGRRVAGYRRAAGFKTAEELAAAIANPAITKSTIQNVESGRKADLSVMQLLDISKALGIPPVALVVPINQPFDRARIPGASEAVSQMTNWELVEWLTMREEGGTRTSLGLWIGNVMTQIERLVEAVREFPDAYQASQIKQEVIQYTATSPEGDEYLTYHNPNEWAENQVYQLAQQAQDSYHTLKNITKTMDLSWAEGPWLDVDLGSDRLG